MARPKGSKDSAPRKSRGVPDKKAPKLPKALENYNLSPEENNAFNSNLAAFQIEVMKLRQYSKEHIDDADVLIQSFQEYLALCTHFNMRITNAGAYSAMGIDRQKASSWRLGKLRKNDPRFAELVDLVDSLCSVNREQLMIENKIMPGVGIFWQKNYDGMKDEPEGEPDIVEEDDLKTPEQVKEQYKYLLDSDDGPKKP